MKVMNGALVGECKQESARRKLAALFWVSLGKIKMMEIFSKIRSFGIHGPNFHALIYLVERHEAIVDFKSHYGHSCRI